MKILIAEDDRIMRFMLEAVLQKRGYTVESASDGKEALGKAMAAPPDLIVSDVMMPEMDGFLLCKEVKAESRLRHIPVILYTATRCEAGEAELVRKLGAVRFVIKTGGIEPLLAAIKEEQEHIPPSAVGPAPEPACVQDVTSEYISVLSRKLYAKENELRRELDREKMYLDVAGAMLIALDRDGRISMVNKKGSAVLGWGEAELIGRDWFTTCLPPEIREEVAGVFKRLMAGDVKPVEHYENPVLDRRGERHLVAFHNAVVKDAEGQITGVLFSGEDVTERRSAEAEVRLKELFLDSATDHILVHDFDGNILYANEAVGKKHGCSPRELRGAKLSSIVVEPEGANIEQRMHDLKRSGSAIFNVQSVERDGSLLELEVHAKIIDAYGRKVVLTVGRDVTERKRVEEALFQAQKLDSIGLLSAGIAHDLNNLLGPILAYADFLRKSTPPGSAQHEDINEISMAAGRAAELVRQLLAFSRRQKLELKVLSLNSVVQGLDGMLRRVLREHVRLAYSLDPSVGMVKVDPGQMEQVVVNLALNACEAMPKGGTLTISTMTKDCPGGEGKRSCVLSVGDTGCGMEPDVLRRIFEPFFTTKDSGRGMGLGLSAVYGIVKQSGGEIHVESVPGKGSVFSICLPLADAPAAAASSPDPRAIGAVLVVEDDETMMRIAKRILSSSGYKVLGAVNGKEALGVLAEKSASISLVLTDMVMPELDGVGLAKEVVARYPGIRILCMSGYDDKQEELRTALGDKVGYLQKPFAPDVLLEKVGQVLSRA
ncbi:MAG: response regulator [Elusimicrobia bacterium]|nr:response regulator [Elusimicrobiota bacterium]